MQTGAPTVRIFVRMLLKSTSWSNMASPTWTTENEAVHTSQIDTSSNYRPEVKLYIVHPANRHNFQILLESGRHLCVQKSAGALCIIRGVVCALGGADIWQGAPPSTLPKKTTNRPTATNQRYAYAGTCSCIASHSSPDACTCPS